jgi:eukaryotic-like serine/threonine-protein kinase
MASLTHAIRSFQSGGMSYSEFFAQVDRLLARGQTDSAYLARVLDDEHTRVQLPPDVYAELQRRVEQVTGSRHGFDGNETRVQTNPSERRFSTPSGSSTMYAHPPGEPERMKGVGDTLNGRFVLEECIGFGGMGTVYRALDLRKLEASDRNPYIAIKVLNVQFRGHPKSLIALQREAKKAQALAHPNIVTVYDFDRDGSTVFLTMECLSGKPLSQTLRSPDFKGMSYAETMRIISGIAKALAYAHERGFVHCDLKPANVFLMDKGEVKVIDFGIARVFQKQEEDAEATVFDPGSLGAMTPAYASPEMIEHRVPDPRDDIYALACITYELLAGRHPFDRLSATQARNAGLKPHRPKNLGHSQWRALKAALAFEREARTPTVARFMQGMVADRKPALYVGLGVVALLLAALIGFALNRDWRTSPAAVDEQAREQAPAVANPPRRTEEAAAPAPVLSVASVAPVLAGVPCSALMPTVRGDTLAVQGYVGKSFGNARLKETLGAVPGVKAVNLDVQEVGDEKCGVISLLAPYWVGNRQAGAGASIHTKKPGEVLTEGDYLVLDIKTPAYDSYVNVDYYAASGGVVHMVPSPRVKGNQAPPSYTATIGGLGNWVVSKPFGTDLIVLLVTPAPLFEGLRPESESTAGYLQAVEGRLKQLADKYGAEKISADFVQITTRGRKS